MRRSGKRSAKIIYCWITLLLLAGLAFPFNNFPGMIAFMILLTGGATFLIASPEKSQETLAERREKLALESLRSTAEAWGWDCDTALPASRIDSLVPPELVGTERYLRAKYALTFRAEHEHFNIIQLVNGKNGRWIILVIEFQNNPDTLYEIEPNRRIEGWRRDGKRLIYSSPGDLDRYDLEKLMMFACETAERISEGKLPANRDFQLSLKSRSD